MIKNVSIQSAMIRNSNGTLKETSFGYTPKDGTLGVAKGTGLHGRPLLIFEGEEPGDTLIGSVFPSYIEFNDGRGHSFRMKFADIKAVMEQSQT